MSHLPILSLAAHAFGGKQAAILIGILCAIALLKILSLGFGPPAPIAKSLMTSRERAMLHALEQVLPMYRLHAQVAMGAILQAPRRLGQPVRHSDRNAVSQKIVDFVVEDPTTGRIVALIELDDRSHDPERDRRRDAMTSGAGYTTIRIPASARPTVPTAIHVVGHLRQMALATEQEG